MLTLTSPFHPIRVYSSNFMVHVNQMTRADPHCDVARREPLRATQGRVVKNWGFLLFPPPVLLPDSRNILFLFRHFCSQFPHRILLVRCIALLPEAGKGKGGDGCFKCGAPRDTQPPCLLPSQPVLGQAHCVEAKDFYIYIFLAVWTFFVFLLSVVTVVFPSVSIVPQSVKTTPPFRSITSFNTPVFAMNFEHAQYKAPHCIFENIPVPEQSIPCLFLPPHRIASNKRIPTSGNSLQWKMHFS